MYPFLDGGLLLHFAADFGDFLDRALCTCHQCGIVRSPSGELDEKTEYGAILWNTGGDILSI